MELLNKYNRLTFISLSEPKVRINGAKRKMAIFQCDCGDAKEYDYSAVIKGRPRQCKKCAIEETSKKNIKHSLINHSLYRKWQDMKKRCYNENVDRYKNYGALGIRVCDEWKDSFINFYNWSIANGWKEGLTIERLDNYKNYTPENCSFITHQEQGYNKKNTFYFEYNGNKYSLSRFLNETNNSAKYKTIWRGINAGKTFESFLIKYNIEQDLKMFIEKQAIRNL